MRAWAGPVGRSVSMGMKRSRAAEVVPLLSFVFLGGGGAIVSSVFSSRFFLFLLRPFFGFFFCATSAVRELIKYGVVGEEGKVEGWGGAWQGKMVREKFSAHKTLSNTHTQQIFFKKVHAALDNIYIYV